jgi:hypothetical protein
MPILTDCETAVSVFVTAFADDPVLRWLVPQPGGSGADLLFRPLVQASAAQGELAVCADGTRSPSGCGWGRTRTPSRTRRSRSGCACS